LAVSQVQVLVSHLPWQLSLLDHSLRRYALEQRAVDRSNLRVMDEEAHLLGDLTTVGPRSRVADNTVSADFNSVVSAELGAAILAACGRLTIETGHGFSLCCSV
jgi:hypothetical protein